MSADGDLLSWRDTRAHAYPLGSLHRDVRAADPPPPPPPPARPRKAKHEPTTEDERGAPRGRIRPVEWLPWADPRRFEAIGALCQLDAFVDGSGKALSEPYCEPAGAGVVIVADGVVVAEMAVDIGFGSNNRAEVEAIVHAIGLAWRVCGGRKSSPRAPLTIYSDSEFAIGAVNPMCNFNVRAPALYASVDAARAALLAYGPVTLCHVKGHRRLPGADPFDEFKIRGNNRADELATIGRLRCEARVERELAESEAAAKAAEAAEGTGGA